MQILDELETVRRGPYGGGIGVVSFSGAMDMALALRTMVIPTACEACLYDYAGSGRREWLVSLQVGPAPSASRCCASRRCMHASGQL